MSTDNQELTTKVSRVTSQIIEINGRYYAEIKNKQVDNFLAELALSLAAEVDSLRDRLILLEEQIRIYENNKS